jgi:ribosome-binding protein aMBF1 (putative translation factor)
MQAGVRRGPRGADTAGRSNTDRGTGEIVVKKAKPKTWSERVRAILERNGWTQKELGERVGLSFQNINDFACNRGTPPRPVQKLLAMIEAGDDLEKWK